jgi:HAD superfamily hydrolase (TIGR01509 family)
MIKLIIFDLDGVLIDSRELHYEALNSALVKIDPKYIITREEHLSRYDGLNTTAKLELLHSEKGLPKSEFNSVWQNKQSATIDAFKQFSNDEKLISIFLELKQIGYKIGVASNSIRETVKLSLLKIGILEYVDYYVSNEDVKRPKPFPEMYWKCMTAMGHNAKETLIIEDSHIGRAGAIASGAHLLPVEDCNDLSMEKIRKELMILNGLNNSPKVPWRDNKLNVLIPMAGAGSRFATAGYTFPKPLIEVNGKPMIQVVVNNLNIDANYIFIVQKEHYDKYNLKYLLNLIAPDCKIVQVEGVTEGAACTTLLAKEFIDNDEPLVIANSDQFIEWNSLEFFYKMNEQHLDAGIVSFRATHPKWSYAKVDDSGFVTEVAEKNPISDIATVGVYYWKQGKDFVKYAESMILKNIRVNNEFYVCPVFNEGLLDGLKIKTFDVPKMWGIGTPEDLNYFLENYK